MAGKEAIWNKQKIKEGFDKFFLEFGRYPTAVDIDGIPYLPSARQLQRRFGGVMKLREEFDLPILDFSKGKSRSESAYKIGKRGVAYEREIRQILVKQFGEICVHAQKPFNDYQGRLDFFVYAKKKQFGVDVFFAGDTHSLKGCINIKERIYRNIDFDLVLLQLNPGIIQAQIDKFIFRKKNHLDTRIKIMTLETFLEFIKDIEPLKLI